MTPERWHRIEELFEQASELPTRERSLFLVEECAGDSELRHEVASLVESSSGATRSLRRAVAAEADKVATEMITAHVGKRIGSYRLVALLGEGGMGAVYLAERDDAQFTHQVAIKILHHTVGSPQAIARFRDERQILAALEHPNIVRLLDGGTDEGLPYLVMERVDGVPLNHYARDRGLSVRGRVELVRSVCAALQYAHQNLVVHRDIKPSNILVEADGTPKLLDFGIAKLLAPVASFERQARTRTGLAMLTPEYASPEQARGDAVSTATDVYSLGAVLYELVTGRPPHEATGGALDMLHVICEVDPPRPSAAAPGERARELAGDLDNIILKALQKDPARRYASAEQLADDLTRYLDGLPVTARVATVGYRARKFVRRNRGAVVATALVVVALLGATIVSARQARRADDQAALAEAEKANAVIETERAKTEADRARAAELKVQAQLDQIKSEQAARAAAERDARARGHEVEMSKEQLEHALARTKQEKLLAEQESERARQAELRAEAAARAEKATREEAEKLYEKEKLHVAQLEEKGKLITNELRK